MKTLQRILGLAAIGTSLIGARLEAQEQPAPIAPEPEEAAPAQVVPEPETPAPDPAQPAPPDDPGALQAPPPQPDAPLQPPADNPIAQPPAQPATQPPADPLTQPPYSPQPEGRPARIEFTPPEDPFLPPPGMVTAPECLIEALGFFGHHPFVYSDSNCFDLASAAYRCGYFEDAIALLTHAVDQYPQAHYYYLRGMAQMKAGLAHDALVSADGVLDAEAAGNYSGLDRVRERFNGPLGVQFRQLLQLRQAAR